MATRKTVVISGGNSGIGLEAGRQLATLGHSVVLLGRDPQKGATAVAQVNTAGQGAGGSGTFIASDLSTHDGVRAAAARVREQCPTVDGLILGAGVLMLSPARTKDGLHPIVATNYLSRYHLAQLLLPELQKAVDPTVVILVAGVPLTSTIDFARFPKYEPAPAMGELSAVQIANYHYVQHLGAAEKKVRAAVMNVGLVKTEIMRATPWWMKLGFAVLGPLITVPVETSAKNAVWLTTHADWASGIYLPKPGDPSQQTKLALDAAQTEKAMQASRDLVGV